MVWFGLVSAIPFFVSRLLCLAGSSHGGTFLDNLTDPRASAREYEVVFGLSGNSSGKPDLGLTMQADYYGNQAIVKGFSLVDGRVRYFQFSHSYHVFFWLM